MIMLRLYKLLMLAVACVLVACTPAKRAQDVAIEYSWALINNDLNLAMSYVNMPSDIEQIKSKISDLLTVTQTTIEQKGGVRSIELLAQRKISEQQRIVILVINYQDGSVAQNQVYLEKRDNTFKVVL